MEKIYHAKESLERLRSRRLGVLFDGFHFACKGTDTVFVRFMTKELNLGQAELAFLHLVPQAGQKGYLGVPCVR